MRNLYFPVEPCEEVFYSKIAIYPVNELLLEMLFFTTRWKGQISRENETAYSFIVALKKILPSISIHSLPLGLPYPKSERLLKVARYMNQHLQDQLSFPDIAKRFGFSERTLSRTFQQEVKMSFIQFLTVQRMMKSLQLLLDEKKTVNETAYAVGYNSLPTFSNTFSKIVGVRPSEYVKLRGVLKKDS
ncbi:HTH-type transcriptional activator Btr [compost metagenome]